MERAEWLQWRKQGLGSSDYAVVMGVSPWSNIDKLYVDKTTECVKEEGNQFAMSRGVRMEPRIRALFELKAGESFEPKLLVMEGAEWMRVSLDGASEDAKRNLEIKFCGAKDYELATKGIVPPKYVPQVQGQLLVSGADLCYFVCYPFSKVDPKVLDVEKLAVVTVFPDKEYQKALWTKCHDFWFKNVKAGVPPGMEAKAHIVPGVRKLDVQAAHGMVELWKKMSDNIDKLEKVRDALREKILEVVKKTGKDKVIINGVSILKVSRVGSVQYKTIPELKDVDLEKYRGKGSVSWQLKIKKEKK